MTTKTKPIHEHLDLLGLQIKNFAIQELAADPDTTYPRIYKNSVSGKYRQWIGPLGTDWEDVGSGSGTPANDSITNAMLHEMAAGTVLANVAGGVANPTDVDIDTAFKTALALVKGDVGLSNLDNVQQLPMSYLDTDTALAANSDVKVPSQKAIKAYADALIAANDAMVFKGVIDASTNPNYPASNRGDTYRISVAGKIGGAAGPNVEAGDILIALTDGTAAGTHAAVGANWNIVQANADGLVIGPAASADGDFAQFDGATGKLLKNRTPTQAKSDLGLAAATSKFAATIGDGATADIVVNHALNTRDVSVTVRDAATPYAAHDVYWEATDANNVTIFFPTAPANNELRCVVIG